MTEVERTPSEEAVTSCPDRPSRPLRKMVCVGRNYAAHVAEMQAERPAEPLLFLKPSTAWLDGSTATELELPRFSTEVHHEVELVLRIGRGGKDLPPARALEHVDAVAVGLDLTARDLQAVAKKRGEPWAVAKGFDHSAPTSAFVPWSADESLEDLALELSVDGELRQKGSVRSMLFPPAELVAFVSSRFRLEAGDLVFTGTPEGVGPLLPGSKLSARLTRSAANGAAASIATLELVVVAPGSSSR